MQHLLRLVTILCTIAAFFGKSLFESTFGFTTINDGIGISNDIIKSIYEEETFETIFLIQQLQNPSYDNIVEEICEFPTPKIILTNETETFELRGRFNTNILTILIMSKAENLHLIDMAARSLNYMRQTRIMVIAVDVSKPEIFKDGVLKVFEDYRMTNVILRFIHIVDGTFRIKPYPQYHWEVINETGIFSPENWRNLHNKTILTFSDQTPPRALLFLDPDTGELNLNGYVPRLIMLFAEHYNASLKMFQPLELGNIMHYTLINDLTNDNLVDIPMVIDTGVDDKWMNMTDAYEVAQGMLMVPCAQPVTINEVYFILLSGNFAVLMIVCTISLSLVHSVYDYLFSGHVKPSKFVFNDSIIPGVLGQSFASKKTSWVSLKLVYVVLFYAGLHISTLFSADMQSLFTSPSYHQQIQTMDQLKESSLQILLDNMEFEYISPWIETIKDSLLISQNSSHHLEYRQNFNTSYGYYTSSSLWEIFERKQLYFTHKIFCTSDNLTVFRFLPWSIHLQHNSPYKEALNYLIHQVHSMGLVEAWHSSIFSDMLRLKLISIRDPSPEREADPLTVKDLFWVWIIILVGLSLGILIFFMEMWLAGQHLNILRICKTL